jgi:hypothetical protein
MNIEKYSCYEFSIYHEDKGNNLDAWVYVIYDPTYKPCAQTIIREAEDWFDTEQEARFAAIGHIDLLESGEG